MLTPTVPGPAPTLTTPVVLLALTLHLLPLSLALILIGPGVEGIAGLAPALVVVLGLVVAGQLVLARRLGIAAVGLTRPRAGTWPLILPVLAAILAMAGVGVLSGATTAITGELALVVVVLCLAAFSEEFTFRGVLLGAALDRLAVPAAIGGAAVVFSGAHVIGLAGQPLTPTAVQMSGALGFGLAFGALRVAGGSILPLVLLHVAWNAAALAAGPRLEFGAPASLVAPAAAVLVIAAVVWVVLRPRLRRALEPVAASGP